MSKPCCGTTVKEEMIGGFKKWEVDGWLHTLITAEEVYDDKKKLKAVLLLLKARQKDTTDVEATVQERLKKTFGGE